MAILVRGHVAIITETKSTYVMIESTLRFDDIEVIPGLLPLLWVVQRSRMQSRNGVGDSLGMRLRQMVMQCSLSDFNSLVPLFVVLGCCYLWWRDKCRVIEVVVVHWLK